MSKESRHNGADELPQPPVGLDCYRHWDQWPLQRIGIRGWLLSTYDRTGHNHTADASHYLYQESEDFNVTLDVEGAGILYFVRTNRWHGSPWHYEIDGVDHIVAETASADPLSASPPSTFIPETLFPEPLAYTWETTHGADLNWVPMPFAERLRIAYSRTFYGTGYYILHRFADGSVARRAESPWASSQRPVDVLALLSRAGDDLTPAGATLQGGTIRLSGERVHVVSLTNGPAMVRRLSFSAPAARAREFALARIAITWDRREHPSVNAPLGLFHGAGTLHNPQSKEWLVKAFPVSIRFSGGRVELACHFPMPYFRSADITLTGVEGADAIDDVHWSVATVPYDGAWNHVGYFHGTYVDHAAAQLGHDLEFLDTQGIEGHDDWTGSIVGTAFIFTHRNVLTTLEGDPRFFFDDSRTPQVQGTGTEEWGGGGDYWGGRTMTLPLAGHPTGAKDDASVRHPDDRIHSAYRFLLADLMPFGKRARICFEHGGENESAEYYHSVTHWYGLPGASLVLTDSLDVGDTASESAHRYRSPRASEPYALTSRYELGPDHLPAAIAGPLAAPDDLADFEFEAKAGVYNIWIEACVGEDLLEAAVWPQFDDDIGTASLKIGYMGSMGFPNSGHPPGSWRFASASRPPARIRLAESETHRLRLQPRHGLIRVSRILLSPERDRRPALNVVASSTEILLGARAVRQCRGGFSLVADGNAPGGLALAMTRAPREVEIYAAERMTGRTTLGVSEFSLNLVEDNQGVLLRRTLDYGYANQRAKVYVGDEGDWQFAGIWYLAGSNTVYHSFPWADGELGSVNPKIITSNRRFRDDEFLLPAKLTRGKRTIGLRIEFAPRNPPLLPGMTPQNTAWTEFAYHAYCLVMPQVPDC